MIIIPAVDILGSKCVRLTMGDYDVKKEYELSPLEAALNWQKLGAKRLHLVDLNGAKSGNPDNFNIIKIFQRRAGFFWRRLLKLFSG